MATVPATARVPSVEPSSTTMMSAAGAAARVRDRTSRIVAAA